MTWAMNTFLPGLVSRRFADARTVASLDRERLPVLAGNRTVARSRRSRLIRSASTPSPASAASGCSPFYSERDGTSISLIRLNYADALRYGVLLDIAQRVASGEPVDVTTNAVNVIWQGDSANAAILRSFDLRASPPFFSC